MVKHLTTIIATLVFCVLSVNAQSVSVKWANCDGETPEITTSEELAGVVTTSYVLGSKYVNNGKAEQSNFDKDNGYEPVTYDPAFTMYYLPEGVAKAASPMVNYCVTFNITVPAGYIFIPSKISIDAAKGGTDSGNICVRTKVDGSEKNILAGAPLRNKIMEGNSVGYTTFSGNVTGVSANSKTLSVIVYLYNVGEGKSMLLRNLQVDGMITEVAKASTYIESLTCSEGSLMDEIKNLVSGESTTCNMTKRPSNFVVKAVEGYDAKVEVTKSGTPVATISVSKDGSVIFSITLTISVKSSLVHGEAKPLNRGLLAIKKTSGGNMVSWRVRATDGDDVTYNVYRDGEKVNDEPLRIGTLVDSKGTATSKYKLEVVKGSEVVEQQEIAEVWTKINDVQTKVIKTSTPVDERGLGATYTPNDAAYCDMDGDGEYEIILKWDPSNAKDPSQGGTTSSTYIDCYKLDGTQLWRINLGKNIRSGAHTTPFLCYDFDGDGFGELMVKTAPGTIDGDGNNVVMDGDDPNASYASNGRILSGPEYLTVFDGPTGAEVTTVKYHTTFDEGRAYWGDTGGNRSDRYLACAAYLDGVHPSAVFARGYYEGAFVGAYDFDGKELKLRWLHKSIVSGKGLWAEGAHSIIASDVDGDGKDEITYGSAALDDDGTLLYRTGLKHGDSEHFGDLVPDREGWEVFMVHEKTGGYDLRDAKTGEILVRVQGEGDTGRGIAADFDDQHIGHEMMSIATAYMYDCHGEIMTEYYVGSITTASLNYRIYWDGDLYDEYFDRMHVDKWSSQDKSFGRLLTINNGSATTNGTKNNACIVGDILGDWREEILAYRADDNALLISTTEIPTEYRVPFLRDDRAYDMAMVWQNTGYNQPAHLSYDLPGRFKTTLEATVPEGDGYWRLMRADQTYILPEGAKIYTITKTDNATQSVVLKEVETRALSVNSNVLVYLPESSVECYPAASNTSTAISSTTSLIRYTSKDKLLQSSDTESYYLLRDGESGWAFYRITEETVPAGTLYLRRVGSSLLDVYYLTEQSASGIELETVTDMNKPDVMYNIAGQRVKSAGKGLYIINGKKVLKK